MDNWLIFQYHHVSDQAEPSLLRKALRGLPTQLALGQRWDDAEG
jgi:hypothetical protein